MKDLTLIVVFLSYRYWNVGKKGAEAGGGAAKAAGGAKEKPDEAKSPRGTKEVSEDALEPGKFPGIDVDFKVDVTLLDQPAQKTKLLLATSMERRITPGTKTLSISDYFKRLEDNDGQQ